MKVDISVVIPTRNRKQSLMTTINSYCNGTYIPNQIVIVDQSDKNYKDEIQNELSKFSKTEITYYYLEKPSLTSARNIGKKLAKYDIMICSDDDILVYEDTLKNIYEILNSENDIALIAGIDTRTQNVKVNKIQSILGYLFTRKNIFKKTGHVTKSIFGTYPRNINKRVNTEWAMGYFFALRRELIINKPHMDWDENLISYAYPEDLDFSYRFYRYIKEKNMKMILDPLVKVEHCTSREWRLTSQSQTLMYVINREYLAYKLFENDIVCRIMTRWANIGEFCRRFMKNDNPLDIIKAQYVCDKYRKQIKLGNIKEILSENK